MVQKKSTQLAIPALRVRQWLPQWDEFRFDESEHQSKPSSDFFLFSMSAIHLKALTGVYRRSTKNNLPRSLDQNIQRGHEQERSAKIKEFVDAGYPWCELGSSKQNQPEAMGDRKPGWIPTAILVNILLPGEKRNGNSISKDDSIQIQGDGDCVSLTLPNGFSGAKWVPSSLFPLEVIDGQHRLWAFENTSFGDDFKLPVVASVGLDRGWQAYLFWSVNITPKKINRSLAFDLYPLLRQQSWLDRSAGHSIYRETRCQELVEALWLNPESPWHQRINMLGETIESRDYKGQVVTQAAFIRSLMASFVKQWNDSGEKLGGLFGASGQSHTPYLPWNRAMQAAFLIYSAKQLKKEIGDYHGRWAEDLREAENQELFPKDDAAFYGANSLLTTDQGIRGFLLIVNDLCCSRIEDLKMQDWRWDSVYDDPKARSLAATEEGAVSAALKSLQKQASITRFLDSLFRQLAAYDWRSSSTPSLSAEERSKKLAFRGSSGYRELRRQLLEHLVANGGELGSLADEVLVILGYK